MLERFEIKANIIGGRESPFGNVVFLGRTIRWTTNGLEVEGDTNYLNARFKGMRNGEGEWRGDSVGAK